MGSRMDINNAKTMDELIKKAMLEESGDELLYVKTYGKTRTLTELDVYEDIWTVGGTKTLLYAARPISIVSTSVQDKSTGTGAYSVAITGLDGDYNIIKEIVNLNGTTPVTTTQEYMRLERMQIFFAGSNRTNVGKITATETTGSTVQGQIEAGIGVSQMCGITCPAGYTAILINVIASCHRSSGTGVRRGELEFIIKTVNQTKLVIMSLGISNEGGILSQDLRMPTVFPEKTQLHFAFDPEATGTVAATLSNVLLVKGKWNQNDNTFY